MPAPGAAGGVRAARPGWLLAIVLTGQFMALINLFIVNVAVPTLRTDLNASGAALQLVVSGYTIAYAVLLITGARLGGLLGHRRLFLTGLSVFTLASLACGLAVNTGALIGFRLLQGAGAAAMIPQVLSLVQRNFAGSARARALSVYSAVLASGAAIGQTVGGALISADLFGLGWRPVFLVNVPIGVALLVVGLRLLPRDQPAAVRLSRALDLPGLVTLAAAVGLFVAPLVLGQEEGWPLWGWVCLALSPVVFAVFAAVEVRLARRGGAPLIAWRVLRAPTMGSALVVIFLSMAANAGLLFTTALYFQEWMGRSAMATGLTFLPAAIGFGVVGLTWGRLPVRLHRSLVIAGFLVAAVSLTGMALAVRDQHSGGAVLPVLMAGVGVGIGAAFSPVLTLALARVRPQDAPDATGLLTTMLQLGLTTGVAAFGTLFLGRESDPMAPTALALGGSALLGAVIATGLLRGRKTAAPTDS